MVPLAAFTAYSATTILTDRVSSVSKMKKDEPDSDSAKFASGYIASSSKESNATATYCDVKIGAQVLKVYDIKPANKYFSVAMHVWMDFSQDDFHEMYRNYKNPSWTDEAGDKKQDVFTVAADDSTVTYAPDGVPDYIELIKPFTLLQAINDHDSTWISGGRYALIDSFIATSEYNVVSSIYKGERKNYPGLHESTIYKDYPRNFDIGKGLDDSSLVYYSAPGEAYYLTDSGGVKAYRFFQNMNFTAKVGKAYDNPRYPLESAQFWLNIVPTSYLNVSNIRFTAAQTIDVSRAQESGNTGYATCSIDEGVFSAMSEDVAFTDGFRSIKASSGINSHYETIEYDIDADHPEYSYSKYTMVIRANRAAFTAGNFLPSTFLQSYINLFAVIIWIIIAFYNQSFAGEDSLGMLGTGMFSAISATIVGLQTISDAGMFSLLTMINIFTLAVILIMTFQAVMSKRARANNDKAAIAYNGVKLRLTFYILAICTAIMFIGLPIASYIWTI